MRRSVGLRRRGQVIQTLGPYLAPNLAGGCFAGSERPHHIAIGGVDGRRTGQVCGGSK